MSKANQAISWTIDSVLSDTHKGKNKNSAKSLVITTTQRFLKTTFHRDIQVGKGTDMSWSDSDRYISVAWPRDLRAAPRADTNCPGSTDLLHSELTPIWCFRWRPRVIWQKSHGTDCLDTQHAMLWLVPKWCPVAKGANSNDVIATYNSPPSSTRQSFLLL